MNAEEYIQNRVDEQIDWYYERSEAAKLKHRAMRTMELVVAGTVPVLAGFASSNTVGEVLVAVVGASIVVLVALQELGQYHKQWLECRSICDALRQERALYLTGSGPYGAGDLFPQFVQRVEGLIVGERGSWSRSAQDYDAPNEIYSGSRDLSSSVEPRPGS